MIGITIFLKRIKIQFHLRVWNKLHSFIHVNISMEIFDRILMFNMNSERYYAGQDSK